MPLLDHFRPPLVTASPWESFHTAWSVGIMGHMNGLILPPEYRAAVQTHIGARIEADVATFEHEPLSAAREGGGTATLVLEAWAPPVPALVVPTDFPDVFEVRISRRQDGRLVAVIELVSPGNKDRPEARRQFAAKCSSYLAAGVGLVVIDVVTDRRDNMHNVLMELLLREEFRLPDDSHLAAYSYRPVRRDEVDQIECWPKPLSLAQVLPVIPLPLLGGPTLPLDLEVTYNEARRVSRL